MVDCSNLELVDKEKEFTYCYCDNAINVIYFGDWLGLWQTRDEDSILDCHITSSNRTYKTPFIKLVYHNLIHETIHLVITSLEGLSTSKTFDKIDLDSIAD